MQTNMNFLPQQFVKDIVEKIVVIALLFKKLMILLKGDKV